MSEPKVSNQQLQAYLQDRMEGVTYSWEWPKLQDAMHDLLDIRRRIAELEAQLAEARRDGENADEKSFAAWWMRLAEQLSGLEPPFREKNIAICLASAFRQGKRAAIAAAAAEGKKG